jgi:Transposase DDE domain
MNLLELFVHVDDFCQTFKMPQPDNALPGTKKTRHRHLSMHPSEIMTLLIWFHTARYRDFKTFYTQHVKQHLASEFPTAPSYNRFIEWLPRSILPLTAYLFSLFGSCSGLNFVDSTPLSVCHTRRYKRHKTFAGLAAYSRTSVDWFFGFKLHVLFNDQGELLWVQLTRGNVDDRKGLLRMLENPFSTVFGKIFADKGYVSRAFFEQLVREHGITLVTRLKKNMHTNLPMLSEDAFFLRARAIVETIIDQLKNISQIEHSRHRSPANFVVNLVCGLIAYCHQPKKPSLMRVSDELITA